MREGAARMLHGDARHTHRAHGHGPRALKVAWTVSVGGPVEAQVTASPDEQTLYVASFERDYITTIDVDLNNPGATVPGRRLGSERK